MKTILIFGILTGFFPAHFLFPDAFQDTGSVPYQVHKRPVPQGPRFTTILPLRVGDFSRVSYKDPEPGTDGEAVYRSGNQEIFMLFSLQESPADVEEVMRTILTETRNEKLTEPAQSRLGSNPSYIRKIGKTIAFYAWTRDRYCFSADSKGGNKAALDRFMQAFPY